VGNAGEILPEAMSMVAVLTLLGLSVPPLITATQKRFSTVKGGCNCDGA